MKKLLPILLGLIGLSGGAGAGYVLRPHGETPVETATNCPPGPEAATADDMPPAEHAAEAEAHTEFVKMNNQFVIPVVENGAVAAMVILSLSLEVRTGDSEKVFEREPKLRDAFLQAMFNYANSGGFNGSFTQPSNMDLLRTTLLEVARKTVGATVSDVLIQDIVRKDS